MNLKESIIVMKKDYDVIKKEIDDKRVEDAKVE
jgi:hypothetical protein